MANKLTVTAQQLFDLLLENDLYQDRRQTSRKTLRPHDPLLIEKIKHLYHQLLKENKTLVGNGIRLIPHGIMTPGSVIHLWDYREYSLQRTIKYFKGDRFAAMTLDQIKTVELTIQTYLANGRQGKGIGEFWAHLLDARTTALEVNGGDVTAYLTQNTKFIKAAWSAVIRECKPGSDEWLTQAMFFFVDPAHNAMANALGLTITCSNDTLQFNWLGTSVSLAVKNNPREHWELMQKLTSYNTKWKNNMTTNKDDRSPALTIPSVEIVIYNTMQVIDHITQAGQGGETHKPVPLGLTETLRKNILASPIETRDLTIHDLSMALIFSAVFTTYQDKIKTLYPNIIYVEDDNPDTTMVTLTYCNIRIVIDSTSIFVIDTTFDRRVEWYDDVKGDPTLYPAITPRDTTVDKPIGSIRSVVDDAMRLIDHITQEGKVPETKWSMPIPLVNRIVEVADKLNLLEIKGTDIRVADVLTHVFTHRLFIINQYYPDIVIDEDNDITPDGLGFTYRDTIVVVTAEYIIVAPKSGDYSIKWFDRKDQHSAPFPIAVNKEDALKREFGIDVPSYFPGMQIPGQESEIHPVASIVRPDRHHGRVNNIDKAWGEDITTDERIPEEKSRLWDRFYSLLVIHVNHGTTEFSQDSPVGKLLGELSRIPGFEIELLEKEVGIYQQCHTDEFWVLTGKWRMSHRPIDLDRPAEINIRFIPQRDMSDLYLKFYN